MRPIFLEMKNIGPFVERTRVDFSHVEEGGLFLVSGPTGSGKSFIFDTICYALYGKTPSGREGHLASDHAGVGDEPLINFSFRVGSSLYKVERRLEYEDKAKRGDGTTVRKEKASLLRAIRDPSRIEGEREEPVATKKTDVCSACEEILGLDMEQFSRVMMIPQGEFRELLRAETKDRETLLRKLFDSRLYLEISDELSRRYGKLSDELKGSRSRVETKIETIVNKLGLESGPGEGLTFEEWSKTVVDELDRDLSDLEKEQKGSETRWGEVRKKLDVHRDAYNTDQAMKQAREKLAKMSEKEEVEIKPLESRMELSGRAGHLRGDLGRLEELISSRDISFKDMERKNSLFDRRKEELESFRSEYDEKMPKKRGERDRIGERISTLKNSKDKVEEMDTIKGRIRPLNAEVKRLEKEQNDLSKKKKITAERLVENEREIKDLAPERDLVRTTVERKAGEDLLSILESKEEMKMRLKRTKTLKGDKHKMVKSREKHLQDVRKKREDSIAGELAASLGPGVECPVCGSKNHPDPRKPTEEDVSSDAVSEAERSHKSAKEELAKLDKEATEFETRMNELETRRGEIIDDNGELDLEVDELKSRVAELKKIEKEIRSGEERKKQLEKKGEDLRNKEKGLLESISEIESELNRKKTDLEVLRSRFEDRKEILDDLSLDAERPMQSLQRELERMEKDRVAVSRNIEMMDKELTDRQKTYAKAEQDRASCLERHREARKNAEDEKRKILKKMKSVVGFETIDDLRKAILSEEEEKKIKGKIDDFRDQQSGLRGRFEEYREKLDSFEIEIPDIEGLEEVEGEEKRLEEEWKSVHGKLVRMKEDLSWVKKELKSIDDIRNEMGEKEEEISVVGRLAQQVKGNGFPRISLERFFLAQRFEEVLIASNQRLKILSGGRFILRRAGIKGKRSKGGLDINVYDNYTGQERPANTLSGGQMFLSSLALALGLADVVQSRSGGIRMDALFIDEGFGSLDEETLQIALKVLSELRQGRTVGVISHVGELKRQIRSGFEVIPSPEGSMIRTIG